MVTTAGPYGGPVQSVIAPPGSGSPTVLRILLGAQLRRLREARRLSLEDAGNVIRASHSKISRLETGRVGFKDRDIVDLLTFYGVTDEKDREALRSLAARANSPGWWHDYAAKANEVRFVRGRLRFGNAKHSAPFPSAVVVFRPFGADG